MCSDTWNAHQRQTEQKVTLAREHLLDNDVWAGISPGAKLVGNAGVVGR
jgi:hypothetical protein